MGSNPSRNTEGRESYVLLLLASKTISGRQQDINRCDFSLHRLDADIGKETSSGLASSVHSAVAQFLLYTQQWPSFFCTHSSGSFFSHSSGPFFSLSSGPVSSAHSAVAQFFCIHSAVVQCTQQWPSTLNQYWFSRISDSNATPSGVICPVPRLMIFHQ